MSGTKGKDVFMTVMFITVAIWLLWACTGCGTINGAASDGENACRWVREKSQPAVDNMELVRIRSALDTQNRIMERGNDMVSVLR